MKKLYSAIALCSLIVLAESCGSEQKQSEAPTAGRPPVVINISEEQMAVIQSLPQDFVCFTSSENPVTSLTGLQDTEFASYVTSPTSLAGPLQSVLIRPFFQKPLTRRRERRCQTRAEGSGRNSFASYGPPSMSSGPDAVTSIAAGFRS